MGLKRQLSITVNYASVKNTGGLFQPGAFCSGKGRKGGRGFLLG